MIYRPFVLVLLVLVSTNACNELQNKETENIAAIEEADRPTPPLTTEPGEEAPTVTPIDNLPLGSYVGSFEAIEFDDEQNAMLRNKITLFVDSISAGYAAGRSVVAGNSRPWKGTAEFRNNLWHVIGEEPGDDRYDGVFEFDVDPTTKKVAGQWLANNKKLPVSVRAYELEKREFYYDPNRQLDEYILSSPFYGTYQTVMEKYHDEETGKTYEYESEQAEAVTEAATKLNASTQKLTASDVENLYRGDLEVIRNTIFARHGYSFKNRKMRYF
ncbi:MAG: YARHG domain-containing protein, partial [Bacteroidota bacterium]